MGRCVLYLALTGAASFVLGRFLPKSWFHAERFPFRPFVWERDGAIYRRIGIHRCQKRLPDMSRLFPRLLPAKSAAGLYRVGTERMLQETCVAEFIHGLLALTGFYRLHLWPGGGGIAAALVNALFFNLPFILIQRYNRPRLLRLQAGRKERKACPL